MITFKKIFTQVFDLGRVQDSVIETVKQINNVPQMNGVILTSVSLSGGSADTTLEHGLNRIPQGFIVISKNATADVWTSSTVNPRPELTLIVKSSAAITANIWIF